METNTKAVRPAPVNIAIERITQLTQRPGVEQIVSNTTDKTSTRTATDASISSCRLPQYNQHGNLVDGLYRTFAPPTSEINVEEALMLPPQPKTFRYQLQKMRENGGEQSTRVTTEEDKRAEFERVKNALRSWGVQKPSS